MFEVLITWTERDKSPLWVQALKAAGQLSAALVAAVERFSIKGKKGARLALNRGQRSRKQ